MKKYAYYKIGLFIGLLSFGSLTSCVNTRQELGISWGDIKRSCNRNPRITALAKALTATVGTAALVYGGYRTYENQFNSSTYGHCMISKQGSISSEGYTLMPSSSTTEFSSTMGPDISNKVVESVARAIENGEQKWGNSDSKIKVEFKIDDSKALNNDIIQQLKDTEYSLEFMKCLLENKLDIDAKDSEGSSTLHYAVSDDNKEAVKFLIAKKANAHAKSQYGTSVLGLATLLGREDMVKFILNNVPNVDAQDKNYNLQVAAALGHVGIFKLLLDKGADPCSKDEGNRDVDYLINIKDDYNEEKFYKELKKWLIVKKWDSLIRCPDRTGTSKTEMEKYLKEAIARLYSTDKECPAA